MLVQCGALRCGAVQCSAAQTAELYVRTKYIWAGERTGRSFYASTLLRLYAGQNNVTPSRPRSLLGAGPNSRHAIWASPVLPPHPGPFCPLPSSSLHTLWLPATCFTCQGLPCGPGQPVIGCLTTPALLRPPPTTTQCSGSDPGACLAAWLRNDGIDNMDLSHRTTYQSLSVPPNPFHSLPVPPSPSQSLPVPFKNPPTTRPQLHPPASTQSMRPPL
jgi:hypothetical protein